MLTFARVIRDARDRACLSQRDAATRIGISVQYLKSLEQGRRGPPSRSVRLRFADELDLDTDWLDILAGEMPADIVLADVPKSVILDALDAFRDVLNRHVGAESASAAG